MFERVKEKVLDFLFPTRCLDCGKVGKIICEDCFFKIPTFVQKQENILSIYSYRQTLVDKLLWKLKYFHAHDSAKFFGQAVAKNLIPFLKEENFLIPIPLSTSDKRIHNHAEVLAQEISKNLKLLGKNTQVWPNILLKNTKKKQAHTKSRDEREENVSGKIILNQNSEFYNSLSQQENVQYFLVDDVTTTGATLCEAEKALLESGIKKENILGVVVAH